jgi:hypothetical protein
VTFARCGRALPVWAKIDVNADEAQFVQTVDQIDHGQAFAFTIQFLERLLTFSFWPMKILSELHFPQFALWSDQLSLSGTNSIQSFW